MNQLLQPINDPESQEGGHRRRPAAGQGHQRRAGRRHGQDRFHASDAEAQWLKDSKVQLILVRRETSPEDLRGMKIAQGILTAFGGASSHAALVSRQMGKACIVGCGDLEIDYNAGTLTVNGKVLKAGDPISIDGFTGEVFAGSVETRPSEILQVLISKTLKPQDAATSSPLRATDDLGRRAPQTARYAPMPTSPSRPSRPSRSAPKASACAAPSTCSSTTSTTSAR